jgi:hypothetical protein
MQSPHWSINLLLDLEVGGGGHAAYTRTQFCIYLGNQSLNLVLLPHVKIDTRYQNASPYPLCVQGSDHNKTNTDDAKKLHKSNPLQQPQQISRQ